MYTKRIAPSLLAAAFVAMPCFAYEHVNGEVGTIPPIPMGSTTTRAAVIAEYIQSREAQPAPPPSTLTRATVVAELMRAMRDGTMPPYGEGTDTGTGTMLAQRPDPIEVRSVATAR